MSTWLASSLDGANVAMVRGDEVTLHATESLEVVARAKAPGHEQAIAFCGRNVLIHSVDGGRTVLTVLSLPKLAIVSALEVDAPTRLLAITHQYALFDRAEGAFICHCTPTSAAVGLLRLQVSFDHAVGLEGTQFMTWSARGPEIWDAPARRPAARVAMELPGDTRAVGLVGRQHWLWIATEQPGIQVARLSDGRMMKVALDGAPENPIGHPMTSWLIADVGGAPTAINVALRTAMPLELPPGPRVMTTSKTGPSDAVVLVADGARLTRVVIRADPSRAEQASWPSEDAVEPAAPAPIAAVASASVGDGTVRAAAPRAMTVSERLAERVARAGGAAPVVAAAPVPAAAPVAAAAPVVAPAPVVAAAPPPPPVLRAPAVRPLVSVSHATAAGPTWRDSVLAWARAALAGGVEPLPYLVDSPLDDVIEHGSLTETASRVLHVIYAEWLEGHGDKGVAAAQLAELAGGADAWAEALGTGQLGGLGLVISELGRTRLVASLGNFLDGRPPRSVELVGADPPPRLPRGLYRIAGLPGEDLRACAARLARGFGQIAVCELEGQGLRATRQWAEQGRLEAWLRQRPVITSIDLGPIEVRATETVLRFVPAGAADVPGGPPWWRD